MRALALLFIFSAGLAHAGLSFHYNENGGFGLYVPEGWHASINGRSSRVTGPATDFAQSEIFAGSDWVGRVRNLEDLRAYVTGLSGGPGLQPLQVGTLHGFSFEREGNRGYWFLLRESQNVIVLEYSLRGSAAQVEEAREILSSFEIRTGGISYP